MTLTLYVNLFVDKNIKYFKNFNKKICVFIGVFCKPIYYSTMSLNWVSCQTADSTMSVCTSIELELKDIKTIYR